MKSSRYYKQHSKEVRCVCKQTCKECIWIVLFLSLTTNFNWFTTGNSQYQNRLKDISLLKIEICNLHSQKNLLSRGLANTADMRQEVLQLMRNLTQERVKAQALEEEMITPMNIHRWRKLTGKDPNRMDLMVKIQTLQRYWTLITKRTALYMREYCSSMIGDFHFADEPFIKQPRSARRTHSYNRSHCSIKPLKMPCPKCLNQPYWWNWQKSRWIFIRNYRRHALCC